MEELLGQVKERILDVYKLEFQVETRAQAKRSKEQKQANQREAKRTAAAVFFRTFEHLPKSIFTYYIPFQSSGSQESNALNRAQFGAEMRKIWPSKPTAQLLDFYPLVISYELLEGEVFNSKFCINPLEPISNATMSRIKWRRWEGATSTMKQPLRVTCDLHHKFEMEIPHEDQSSHYDHEKEKFAYLSMRDRIELGKRQVQQSQWGSKYALNGDDSYKHTVGECPTIPTMRDMYGYQSSYTSSWNNHPILATQPQPQPSMSTSSLEQAILKISKVMEDFVGEQQKINSHLNEKIDNMESSLNVRMEGFIMIYH
ncbi:hypothetical protein AAG906_027962 [Vitis piasezkii]